MLLFKNAKPVGEPYVPTHTAWVDELEEEDPRVGSLNPPKRKQTWTPSQQKAANDRRARALTAEEDGNPFADYSMARFYRMWGNAASRCEAFNQSTIYFSNQRCAGRRVRGSPYCSRHGHLEDQLQKQVADLVSEGALAPGTDPQEFVPRTAGDPSWDEALETRLQEPRRWRFALDPDLLDNIGCSLHGGEVPRELLEQLPPDLEVSELAGDGRPWQKGVDWIPLTMTDWQAEKAARKFARVTSGPKITAFDRWRIQPGQEERVGHRRRRPSSYIEPEITVDLAHWRAAP